MIYLIGGPPKCGKTTLARELSRKIKVPWIAVDTLQSIVWAYMDKEERLKKFPASKMTIKTKRNNDLKYKEYSIERIIDAYRRQAKAVYTAIDMMVLGEMTDGNDHIIEGYHIEPRLAAKLMHRYGKDNIRAVFLVKNNQKEFLKGIKKSRTHNDWILGRTKKEETLEKIAKMACDYSKIIKKEVVKHKMKVFLMDKDFSSKIRKAIEYLRK